MKATELKVGDKVYEQLIITSPIFEATVVYVSAKQIVIKPQLSGSQPLREEVIRKSTGPILYPMTPDNRVRLVEIADLNEKIGELERQRADRFKQLKRVEF